MPSELQPYVGPRPFEREEGQRFFGRERESSELLSRVIAHPAVLLYSQSGAGKTSLLNASLIPLLEKEGFEILPTARVRGLAPKDIPAEDITNLYVFNVLMSWTGGTADPRLLAKMTVADFLNSEVRPMSREGMPTPRVAVFDQFEELFTFYPERWNDRQNFFDQVSEALERDRLMRIIFVMREDYIAELDPYVSDLPEKLRTRFRLERLREDAALEAVTEPLDGTGYSFAGGVAEQLVHNLLEVPVETAAGVATVVGEFVEPVQLQVVCQTLWQKLDHSDNKEITFDQLKAFGDVDLALSDFYETAIVTVSSETGVNEGLLRRWFEHTLITTSRTRGTVFRGRQETGGIPNAAVDKLVDQHLIRGELRGGARWYELTHDRLIEPIITSNQQWMLQRSGAEETRQRLEKRAAEWVRQGRPASGLLDEAELLEARRWLESPNADDVGYSEALFALVQASRAAVEEVERQRERLLTAEQQRRAEAEHARVEEQQRHIEEQVRGAKRLRRLVAALAVMFLLAIVTAGYAVNRSSVATSETKRAQQKEREANALLAAVQREKDRANEQTAKANEAKLAADEQRLLAQTAEKEAEKQAQIAAEQKNAAEKNAAAVIELAHRKDLDIKRKQSEDERERADQLTRVAFAFEQSGNLEEAIAKYNDALSSYGTIGNKKDEADAYIHIGALYRQLRQYKKAEESYLRALELKQIIFGPSEPEVATVFKYLGQVYSDQDRFDDGERYYKDALDIRMRKLKENDHYLFESYRDLANFYRDWQQNARAKPLYEKAVAIEEQISPIDPDLADTLSSLAELYFNSGKFGEAENLFKRALDINEKTSDPENPKASVATTLQRLSWLHVNQGNYPAAEEEAVRSEEILERLLYQRSPDRNFRPADLAITYNDRALVYYYQGRYSEAVPLYQQALKIDKLILGPKHREVATLMQNISNVYRAQGKYGEALLLSKQALQMREEVLGPENESIPNSLRSLGNIYLDLGEYGEAEDSFKRALVIVEKKFSPDSLESAFTFSGLATTYSRQARYDEAEPLYQRALAIWTEAQGPEGIRVAAALRALGYIYFERGKYDAAETFYRRALKIAQAKSDHLSVSSSLNQLALLYRKNGRYTDAEPLFKQALAIDERMLGAEHPDLASDLTGLGWLYTDNEKYAEAEPLLKRALAIREKMLKPDHPAVAATLTVYGLFYAKQGKYVEAEQFYKRALAIREKTLGPEHPLVAETLENYAALLRATQRQTEATQMEARAKAIRAKYPQAGSK